MSTNICRFKFSLCYYISGKISYVTVFNVHYVSQWLLEVVPHPPLYRRYNCHCRHSDIIGLSSHLVTTVFKSCSGPSTEEWIKRMWYIQTMEYYSAIKRNEIPTFLETWMDLEIIMLSEVSQTMRHQHQILLLICGI